MGNTLRRIRLSLLVLLLFCVQAHSQSSTGGNDRPDSSRAAQPLLQLDYGIFRSVSPSQVRLEIYYQVYNFGLVFVKSSDDFIARYAVKIQLEGEHLSQAIDTTLERTILVRRIEQTTSRFDFRTSQFNLDVPEGRYRLRFTLVDRATGKERIKGAAVRAMLDNEKYPSLSSVELVQKSEPLAENDSNVFRKGNITVVPSVLAAFNSGDSSSLAFYLEIYPPQNQKQNDSQRVVIETRLRHDARGLVYRDTLQVMLGTEVVRQLRQVSLKDMPPGGYDMEVYLRGRRMSEIDRETRRVVILWDQEQQIKNDWKTILQQLAYVANGQEMKALKAAETLEQRKAAFDQFWLQRDPSVGTGENEDKREFYRRINQADVRFTVGRREGWKTDRGRIFVQFGEPDQLDDVYFSPESQPYQVWHYYRRGEYLRFLFLDEDRDGDYRLLPPYDGRGMRPDF